MKTRVYSVVHNEESLQCMISHKGRHSYSFVTGRNEFHSSDFEVADTGISSWLGCEIIIIAIILIIWLSSLQRTASVRASGNEMKWFGISDHASGHKNQKIDLKSKSKSSKSKGFQTKIINQKRISNNAVKYSDLKFSLSLAVAEFCDYRRMFIDQTGVLYAGKRESRHSGGSLKSDQVWVKARHKSTVVFIVKAAKWE